MSEVDTLVNLIPTAAGGAAFVYAFLFLLRRGDSQQRDNLNELRVQRDEALDRAHRCERELHDVGEAFDRFRSEQRQLRHDLKSQVQAERMEAELWRRRAVQAGWTEDPRPGA